MNTPHYGTPLASFFATANGQRVLYALSAFTVIGLSLGERPLAAVSLLLSLLGRGDKALGIQGHLLDRSIESLLGLVDDARSPDVRTYLNAIKDDQGAILQISPEAMDLMVAGFSDRPGVAYQSTASASPLPAPRKWLPTLGHPFRAASLALFTALHAITSHYDKRYPCAEMPLKALDERAWAGDDAEKLMLTAFGESPSLHANDGIVPLRSQLWGKLVWTGFADHLDVLGHYHDTQPDEPPDQRHVDWLTSGSSFDDAQFEALMDAIANGILKAST
jgi:triacylglycerol lipase